MKKLLLLFAICILGLTGSAQETFDMPGATGTFLTGINDSGEICGYYTLASGNTLAFEIDKYGDTINLIGPGGSNAFVNATGISSNGMVVGNYGTSGNTAQVYIFEPNPGRNAGGTYYPVPTWGGTNTAASGITADTCIAGSYEVGTDDDGALWCKSAGTETALRCDNQGTAIPTIGCDLDINHNVCGYIIEGAQEQCFIYRIATLTWDTFQILGNIKSRALGMNDNGWICGNFISETRGFYAQKLAGQALSNYTQIIVPGATTIYPCHISNKNEIVGFYTDASYVDHGFIIATYDIGFRPSVNGYTWRNDSTGLWPSTYYSQFNYATDPYLSDTTSFPKIGSPPHPWPSVMHDDWPDAVKSFALAGFYDNPNGHLMRRDDAYQKWVNDTKARFQGECFGCSYTSLLVYENFVGYASLFPACAGNTGTANNFQKNNNTLAAISQMQCREALGRETGAWHVLHGNDNLSQFMQYLCQAMRDSRGRPHTDIGFFYQSSGGHSVMPYKLVPGAGGNGIDSIFIYDSNIPGQDGLCITVDLKGGGWHYNGNGQQAEVGLGRMNSITVGMPDNAMLSVMHLDALPRSSNILARSNGNGYTTAFYNDGSRVTMIDDNDSAAYMAIDSNSGTTLIFPHNRLGGIDSVEPAVAFITGSVTTVNKVNLTDTVQDYMGIYDQDYLIRCQTTGGTDTSDNYVISSGSLTYNNSGDSATTIGYIADREDSNYEYGYTLSGLSVTPGYKTIVLTYGATGIILQNFGPPTGYIITTRFLADSVQTFTDSITIGSNTQHIIQPHDTTYSGIYILVDTGMTGHYEDTIFVTQTLTGINRINAPGVTAWPVPTGNQLFMSGPQGLINYAITDALGRNVSSGQIDFGNGSTQKFDVSNFAPGVYIIQGSGKTEKWTYMFVRE